MFLYSVLTDVLINGHSIIISNKLGDRNHQLATKLISPRHEKYLIDYTSTFLNQGKS